MTKTNRGSGQLRLIREARRVGEPHDLLTLVDMAGVLANAGFPEVVVAECLDLPVQGGVTRLERLREAQDIVNAWPEGALMAARIHHADWHSLREPARWWRQGDVDREEVIAFAQGFIESRGRWPRTDEMRRRFGYAVGHKGPGDNPDQGALIPSGPEDNAGVYSDADPGL